MSWPGGRPVSQFKHTPDTSDRRSSAEHPAALLHRRRLHPSSQTVGMRTRRPRLAPATRSAFAGFSFPPDVIVLAVRWYLRFGLSYRDVEELLAERGIEVDHITGRCCIWTIRGRLKLGPLSLDQIAKARSSNATVSRWPAGTSIASS